MSNLLSTGMAWLAAQQKASCAGSATYTRVPDSVALQVTRGKTAFDVQDTNGYLTRIEMEDFLFPAADLVLDGIATLPKQGDFLTEVGIDGVTRRFEVSSPGGSEAHYRFSDQYRTRLRVHTKEVVCI